MVICHNVTIVGLRWPSSKTNVDAVAWVVLDTFTLRCWARAYLVDHGMMFLQEAVDGLQESAISTDLVEFVGQDAIQAIMAKAFEHRRCGTC